MSQQGASKIDLSKTITKCHGFDIIKTPLPKRCPEEEQRFDHCYVCNLCPHYSRRLFAFRTTLSCQIVHHILKDHGELNKRFFGTFEPALTCSCLDRKHVFDRHKQLTCPHCRCTFCFPYMEANPKIPEHFCLGKTEYNWNKIRDS